MFARYSADGEFVMVGDVWVATCTDNPGSYVCTCTEPEFEMNPATERCEDVNECERDLDECEEATSTCANRWGGYECECKTGYQRPKTNPDLGFNIHDFCEDINECVERSDSCDRINGDCINIPGSYQCVCNEGYELDDDGLTCKDINECETGDYTCEPNSHCTNRPGTYICNCDPGYEQSSDEQGVLICIPKECEANLCDKKPYACDFVAGKEALECKCAKPEGCSGDDQGCDQELADLVPIDQNTFQCECKDGYIMDETGRCYDDDECDEETGENDCSEHADCINQAPGYTCECHNGFKGDGFYCADKRECTDPAETYECGYGSYCKNTFGSYDCPCKDGFVKTGETCVDENECEMQHICNEISETCENTEGSYECNCKDGFVQDPDDAENCIDDKECEDTANPKCTGDNMLCADTYGGYRCYCERGFYYSEDTDTCDDVNECACEGEACEKELCGNLETCVNTPGSFSCDCKDGYVKNAAGTSCIDENECTDDTDNCKENQLCINYIGTKYGCECKEGFERSIFFDDCQDIDECKRGNDCDVTAFEKCVNNRGGYECECIDGYMRDGAECKDRDECNDGTNECDENAFCQNTEGSYKCTCKAGYRGSGNKGDCKDFNECTELYDLCPSTADCFNTQGGYKCRCSAGFMADCNTCIDIDECGLDVNNCQHYCTNTEGGYLCSCEEGFNLRDSGRCEEIDECTLGLHNCGEHSSCENTRNSFECVCNSGFYRSGDSCVDINECEVFRAEPYCLGENMNCINTQGGYRCECDEGYDLDESQSPASCVNVDECTENIDNCMNSNSECRDTDGSFECDCLSGYRKDDNNRCMNINECDESSDCTGDQLCVDLIDSYRCVCKPEFQQIDNADGTIDCISPDPCERTPELCQPGGQCMRVSASEYVCDCYSGYKADLDSNNQQICVKEDDCADEPCPSNSDCVLDSSQPNGYRCDCFNGFSMEEDSNGNKYCEGIDECEIEANQEYCEQNDPNSECYDSPYSDFSCPCKPGYEIYKGTCQNCEKECDEKTEKCEINEETDEEECICRKGYELDEALGLCVDINECLEEPCAENAECTNLEPGYNCECIEGTFSNNPYFVDCEDLDECERLGNSLCPAKSTCINLDATVEGEEGYICECYAGYVMNNDSTKCIRDDDKTCWTDENGEECGPEGSCVVDQITLEEVCVCPIGYKIEGKKCVDVDECGPSLCHLKAECKNTVGSFECTCLEGFTGDGSYCRPNDRCVQEIGECHENADCVSDAPGSSKCVCRDGYTGNGFSCKDKNECETSGTVEVCGKNAKCINKQPPEKFACECNEGFARYSSDQDCVDIDECSRYPPPCHIDAVCKNLEGTYQCVCNSGFEGDGINKCDAVNECLLGTDNCAIVGSICIDLVDGFKCECDKTEGYTGNGTHCDKLDEPVCPEDCPEYSTCVRMLDGTFCKCFEGYEKNSDGECEQINECMTPQICNSLQCVDTDGGFRCECPAGSAIFQDICVDDDECQEAEQTGDEICPLPSQSCKNVKKAEASSQGFVCFCEDTECFDDLCADDTLRLDAADWCDSPEVCDENAHKVDLVFNLYKCACNTGYSGNGLECEDVNECEEKQHTCLSTERCVNTPGSFSCECAPGYEPNSAGSCEPKTGSCGAGEGESECGGEGASCSYAGGQENPVCECPEGYVGNGYEDCEEVDPCDTVECPEESVCKENESSGAAECVCLEGFTRDNCEKVEDPCADGNHKCDVIGGECEEKPGAPQDYVCHCKEGYEGDGFTCRNVNECDIIGPFGGMTCPDNTCVDEEGTYRCDCSDIDGYDEDCDDIDECSSAEVAVTCGPYSSCVNTDGAFICKCDPGYARKEENGQCERCEAGECETCPLGNCYVEDPCEEQKHNDCPVLNGQCVRDESPAKYHCECEDGYELKGLECVDIDECSEGNDACDPNAKCVNVDGAFYCICSEGYKGNGKECENVDECKETNNCDDRAECKDLDGSYQCTCLPGLTKATNYGTCEDINECSDETTNTCDESTSTCSNTDGSFKCLCKEGFVSLTEVECEDKNECADPGDNQCNSYQTCDNTVGSYTCNCAEGFEERASGECVDINECAMPNPCGDNKQCSNTAGSYTCDCGENMRFDGETCVSVDNCKQEWRSKFDYDCPYMSRCENKEDGYSCTCLDGFKMENDRCEDEDECEEQGTCADDQICTNTYGGFKCYCKPGYTLDASGTQCVDVNECDLEMCSGIDFFCENTPGSFICHCWEGTTLKVDGSMHYCVDVDECKEGSDHCADIANSTCVNLNGPNYLTAESKGYMCECASGFRKQRDVFDGKVKCMDVNECEIPGVCAAEAECENKDGSYSCKCREGYHGNGKSCKPICERDTCGAYKTCEIAADDTPKCVCRVPTDLARNDNKVCATDGNTYQSVAEMIEETCNSGVAIEIDYLGACQPSCATVDCPDLSECVIGSNGKPKCTCAQYEICPEIYDPRCGSDGETYGNLCEFNRAKCQKREQLVTSGRELTQTAGECPEKCVKGQWSTWGECSVECGKGKTIRTRDVTDETGEASSCAPNKEEKTCKLKPCPGTPCYDVNCGGYKECKQQGATFACECPKCEDLPVKHVCGDDGETYENECMLRRTACLEGTATTVQFGGKCTESEDNLPESIPLDCTLVSVEKREYSAEGVLRIFRTRECKGGCLNMDHCCEPLHTDSLEVKVRMVPQRGQRTNFPVRTTFVKESMNLITACACRSLNEDSINVEAQR